MKKKDLVGLRNKNISELKKMVDNKRGEFYNSYASLKASGEKNVKKSKNLRHEISQILTIIREKEIIEEIEKEKGEAQAISSEEKDKTEEVKEVLSDKKMKLDKKAKK
jgi:ribosomal protein L29